MRRDQGAFVVGLGHSQSGALRSVWVCFGHWGTIWHGRDPVLLPAQVVSVDAFLGFVGVRKDLELLGFMWILVGLQSGGGGSVHP